MRVKLLATAAFACIAFSARADEGLWTFDNFPAAEVRAKYGVTLDQAWLDSVQQSAVRLSTGCSASLVSREGLVLTNHHCVEDCVENLSTPERDHIKNGFLTASRAEERLCPGMQAEILVSIDDVTVLVNAATVGRTGDAYGRARDAAMAGLEKDRCAGREATNRCQVVTLYQGGQYKLYTYRKYSDVRLAFAPEIQTAFFGGDPDNFNFPRYCLDSAFVRLYENGRPVATPNHLVWTTAPPKDGDPVFVAGNPGASQRLFTTAQLASLRDVVQPESLLLNAELRGRLIQFMKESPEHARIATGELFFLENNIKRQRGQLKALLEPAFFEGRRQAETDFRARVAADARLAAEIGDPWAEIAAAQAARGELYLPYTMLEGRAGMGSSLYAYARRLVRAAEERAKANGDRLPEYADARLPLLEKTTLDPEPVEADLEQLLLEFWFLKLRENLTADAPETILYLGKESPETLARTLAVSRLADPALCKRLWDGGMDAIRASDDPMIRFVLKTDATARLVRKQYEERFQNLTDHASERLAKARFAAYSTSVYPDATFTLRLSYGQIAGWTEPGRTIPAFTTVRGLYQRATGEPPFQLAPRWVAAEARLNPDTVFDISTTNDILGGNSGSPLIGARREVLGAIFDGNIHSLGGSYAFDPALNRSISVSTAAITEALEKVYGQTALVAELTAR